MTAIDSHATPLADPHAPAHPPGGAGHGDGHLHSKYPFLAHHFESPAQQFDSGKLGMWIFLATEVLFFGALFALYAVMRFREPQVFAFASQYLDTIMGGVNTCVLILSSLTMALGVHFAQRSKTGPLLVCLILTFLGACGFLVIKYFEYTHKFHDNLKWGPAFYMPVAGEHGAAPAPHADTKLVEVPPASGTAAPEAVVSNVPSYKTPPVDASTIKAGSLGPIGITSPSTAGEAGEGTHGAAAGHGHGDVPHLYDPDLPVDTHQFFAIYYAMTGLHGIHVVIGMGLMVWLMVGTIRNRFNSNYYTPVDLVGLYWHIVDLIWIFLFPLFYLIS
ncbi:MAG: cytochrome c oxidase subunit 3 family protein [Phycisphaerae bacterium]|nr:cytochrome c oxidase subunit 3 family protein [Phycisphaerae bacterium]